jgi:hypothetical protein
MFRMAAHGHIDESVTVNNRVDKLTIETIAIQSVIAC